MIEIDFDKVQVGVADVPFYANDERPVRIPPYVAVKCLNPETCMDCGKDSQPRTGLTAWLAERDDERTPTAWVTLCEEHISSTKRRLPAFLSDDPADPWYGYPVGLLGPVPERLLDDPDERPF